MYVILIDTCANDLSFDCNELLSDISSREGWSLHMNSFEST